MLEQILSTLPPVPDPEGRILHGLGHNEDAVIVAPPPPGQALVQTVDILGPIGNDPRLFGQTAAANALSDVYAMGGFPWSVMNIVAFPAEKLPHTILAEIMQGAMEKVVEAGAVLAGGHTLDGDEIRFGLSVTGHVDPDCLAGNDRLRSGDCLILTKPLGTGVLATAIKAGWQGSDTHQAELYRWTTHLNANAASVLRAMRIRAATDITGFGLGGHLLEMARASGVDVVVDLASLPFMAGVEDLASDGLIPVGSYANRNHASCHTQVAAGADDLRSTLVFDAQTSGGLALAVQPEQVDEARERLARLGEPAWVVARVVNGNGRLVLE